MAQQSRYGIAAQTPEDLETEKWIGSLLEVLRLEGKERVANLLQELRDTAFSEGVILPPFVGTPYINSINPDRQVRFEGDLELEERITNILRWNAMAMVVRGNRIENGIGGHISTYASCATLYEVGFNHFFRGRNHPSGGDHIYFQGHSSPGIYSRAFLEGRFNEENLKYFRMEVRSANGLSSYPHPWLMPKFWEYPTVSMGLGPIQAIYRARFMRYLENRGLVRPTDAKVWAFLGDGETDEPESLGALSLAAREKLDNLIFVINCNLQRLDGPVRGNGKIIQELENVFEGAGWNVIKVIWGSEWDPYFARDKKNALVRQLTGLLDGQFQKCYVEGPTCVRRDLFGSDPNVLEVLGDATDDDLRKLNLGGHDPAKVFAAYKTAVDHRGSPTVILAKTIKGYGLGEAGEGRNVTHQQKKLTEQELVDFRNRFNIPVSDEQLKDVPFYRPPEDSREIRYIKEKRQALGGYVPQRTVFPASVRLPEPKLFDEFFKGTERPVATTMAIVRVLAKLLKDKNIGKQIVPIVPDEARTFGMDALFQQCGIYSSTGQLYKPVDVSSLLYYKESKDGQLLEEGISEAGAMSSFIAAGTSYSMHRVSMIPFYFFYSMFGFQRIGDLCWAAGDSRARGFLIGGTAGRTTLSGEGLQHQDGQSHVLASSVPNLLAYDPAYAYEIAVIIQDGLYRMLEKQEDVFYYVTVGNELYAQPPMPEGSREGILRGMYLLKESPVNNPAAEVQLMGSGAILNEVVKAQTILAERFNIGAKVWSVTSYKQLREDALDIERWNMLHPLETPRMPYLTQCTLNGGGVFVAASDYMKELPDALAKWLPGQLISLGTDGFGRSDGRAALRDFFEVDARYVAMAALFGLVREGKIDSSRVKEAIKDFDIDPEKLNPMHA